MISTLVTTNVCIPIILTSVCKRHKKYLQSFISTVVGDDQLWWTAVYLWLMPLSAKLVKHLSLDD